MLFFMGCFTHFTRSTHPCRLSRALWCHEEAVSWSSSTVRLCGTLSVRQTSKGPSRPPETDSSNISAQTLSCSLSFKTDLSSSSSGQTEGGGCVCVLCVCEVGRCSVCNEGRTAAFLDRSVKVAKQFGDGGTANEHKWCVVTQQGPVDKERRVQPDLRRRNGGFGGQLTLAYHQST